MDRLIQRDKAILEYLTYKYGKEVIKTTIQKIKEKQK